MNVPTTRVHPSPGDMIEVQWDARTKRYALFVRFTRSGSVVVRMEQLDRGTLGVYQRTGTYSNSPRTIAGYDILRIVMTAAERAAAIAKAVAANEQHQADRARHGGETPSQRAMNFTDTKGKGQ